MTRNALGWFEIPVTDFDRARKFYSAIFDFEMPVYEFGPDGKMGVLLHEQGKGVGGAIFSSPKHRVAPNESGTIVYLDTTPDMDTVLRRITEAGGRITMPKMSVPGTGAYAVFIDSEGNQVGLFEQA